jgi:membrane-bound ClpP family serine protease
MSAKLRFVDASRQAATAFVSPEVIFQLDCCSGFVLSADAVIQLIAAAELPIVLLFAEVSPSLSLFPPSPSVYRKFC